MIKIFWLQKKLSQVRNLKNSKVAQEALSYRYHSRTNLTQNGFLFALNSTPKKDRISTVAASRFQMKCKELAGLGLFLFFLSIHSLYRGDLLYNSE
jgi:hypothetical protein